MLNRKRTQNIMLSKYLMFLPVAALLILFSNCTESTKGDATSTTPPTEVKADVKAVPTEVKDETNAEDVYDVVEIMPEYPGGSSALMKYLAENIKYPKTTAEKGIQGRVVVQFVVGRDGSISDTKIVRSIEESLDNEALRVISAMPKWTPGKQKGETVRVKYTVPVAFKLK